ncbi:DmsC/YnfH family molybdoenzyme membrane anchor subunit [Elongatibacter sediminis]|uniref:DmsC/YnfH family molybdoenzyme membrane anchor subunit n=1 Tax=Elongatibacter sediminis TaxID=3119006 RepID=A0AAW9RHM1_9GAMM
MATREFPIVGDSLALGYRFQRHWDDSMAAAFFFGELGAGIFLAGALYGSNLTMIVGVLVTAILKTYFHLAHMGVPSRAWRAISRPDRSWISRGFISIIVFTGAAVLHIALNGFGLADSLGGAAAIGGIVKGLALIAALVVMTYHGFAIADSTSISFWNTGLMPVTSLLYSALGGVTVARVLAPSVAASGAGLVPAGQGAASILLVVAAVALLAMLNAANRGSPGARKSLHLLTREGPWVKLFYGVVLGLGLVLPFALLTLAPASMAVDVVVALAVLAGYFTFRILVFKIGLYDPIISFARQA